MIPPEKVLFDNFSSGKALGNQISKIEMSRQALFVG